MLGLGLKTVSEDEQCYSQLTGEADCTWADVGFILTCQMPGRLHPEF